MAFREFLDFKDSALKIPADPRDIARPVFESISHLYEEYLRFGGFPVVVLKASAAEKAMALDEGKVFENSIFQSFRLKGEVAYYERKKGAEIDFLIVTRYCRMPECLLLLDLINNFALNCLLR